MSTAATVGASAGVSSRLAQAQELRRLESHPMDLWQKRRRLRAAQASGPMRVVWLSTVLSLICNGLDLDLSLSEIRSPQKTSISARAPHGARDRGRRGRAGLQRPTRNVSIVEASWSRCCAAAPPSRTRPPSPFRLAQKNEDGRAGAKACGIAEIGQGLMCRIVDGRATQK